MVTVVLLAFLNYRFGLGWGYIIIGLKNLKL